MTSKQRAYLRSMANTMETILYVGKDGIVPGTITQASDALEAREALNEMCAQLGAEPVQCIGRRFVMYRPSKENPRIVLE